MIPPAVVAAGVLFLTARRTAPAPPAAASLWLDAAGPALAIASGYVLGHWGVAGLRWSLAEALLPWLVLGAAGIECVGSAVTGRAQWLVRGARLALCGLAAAAVVAGAATVEAKIAWGASLGLMGLATWELLRVGATTPVHRLSAGLQVLAAGALSPVLLFASSLKLALLAAVLASALGGTAVVASWRSRSMHSAQGPIALGYLALVANGYFFAELKLGVGVLMLIAAILPTQLRARCPAWVVLASALVPAALALVFSWAPPQE